MMMLGNCDVVKLKSGLIKMIVAKAEQTGEQTVVNCVWFDQDHKLRRAALPVDVLGCLQEK